MQAAVFRLQPISKLQESAASRDPSSVRELDLKFSELFEVPDPIRAFAELTDAEDFEGFSPGDTDEGAAVLGLERRPFEQLAAAGELRAWRHEGFWDCMDTFKDALVLNQLCAEGEPPWLRVTERVAR